MVSQTRLNDAFGELIYAVAIADGIIHEEEKETLRQYLEKHPWGKAVQWSFDYEMKKGNELMDTFEKALDTLKEHGPHKDYNHLVEILEAVAGASNGFQRKEGQIISTLHKSLRAHFLEYLDVHKLLIP